MLQSKIRQEIWGSAARKWVALFLLWAVVAFSYSHLVLWLLWVPLTPLVIRLARRLPLGAPRWPMNLLIHVAGALAISALITLIAFVGAIEASLFRSFFVDLLIYTIIVAVVHAFDYYWKFRERNLKTAQLESQLANAQLHALRVQLNPHFLFNTLNAIFVLMSDDVLRARRMLLDLSTLLRVSLDNEIEQEVPLRKEIALLQHYLKIEQIRFEGRLHVEIAIQEDVAGALVPSLILQPIVENAIKHGVSRSAAAGRIWIRACRSGDMLQIEVEDDGPGFKGQPIGPVKEGIGLGNSRERLGQLYGRRYAFQLRGLPDGGLTAIIHLPLHFRQEAPVSQRVVNEYNFG